MMESVDMDAMMNLLSKQAIEICQKAGFDAARNRIHNTTVEILKALRPSHASVHGHGHGGYGALPNQQMSSHQELVIPASLQLLPLYSVALQKNVLFRGGVDIRPDERSYYHQLLSNASIATSHVFIYPRLFSLHDISTDVGMPLDIPSEEDFSLSPEYDGSDSMLTTGDNQIKLPSLLNLSADRLTSDGLYLLENSIEMIMWIGRNVSPAILNSLFNVTSLDGIDLSLLQIYEDNSDYAIRIMNIINGLRQQRKQSYMQLHFIREGDGYAEAYFARFLVEDRLVISLS